MTQEYIVTEEQLERALAYRIRVLPFMCQNEREDWENFIKSCRSHPYNPQAEREKVLNLLKKEMEEYSSYWLQQSGYETLVYLEEELRQGGE